jgi:hypothetical protein
MPDREYEYRLKAGRVQTRALLYGVGALFMAYMGLTNDRGLELFVIPLSQSNATIAYWVFAALAALFCVVDFASAERRKSLRQRIVLTNDALLVPKSSWAEEEERIPYASIQDLKSFNEPDSVVVIRHRGGEFVLRLDMLPDERAYGELVETLAAMVSMARNPTVSKSPESTEQREGGPPSPEPTATT